jgi:hypothetical protein
VKLSEFTTDACSSALQHLRVQEVESGRNGEAYSRRSREELMMYWHSFLDWEAHQMIAALGGLLS